MGEGQCGLGGVQDTADSLENMVTDHAAWGQGWSGHCISSYVGKYKVRGWGAHCYHFFSQQAWQIYPHHCWDLGTQRFLFLV